MGSAHIFVWYKKWPKLGFATVCKWLVDLYLISIIYANLCVIYAYFQLRQILGLFEAVCKYVALQVIYLHYNVLIYAN